MPWLRLGVLSVGSFTTTVLLGGITGYLLSLRGKGTDTWYLTGYLGFLFALLASYTARYSIFAPAALATGQFSNLIVFAVVCLVQFAYHYEGNPHPVEARVALIVSLAAALGAWGSLFFRRDWPTVYDFQSQYLVYEYGARVSVVTLAGYLWAAVVLARKTVLVSRRAGAGPAPQGALAALLRPSGRSARSLRSFALLTAATMIVAVSYLLSQTGVVSRAAYTLFFNTASLLICLAIFVFYLNNASQPSSLRAKLVGVSLATLMVIFGVLASLLMPSFNRTLAERYRSEVANALTAMEEGLPARLGPEVAFVLPEDPSTRLWRFARDGLPAGAVEGVAAAKIQTGLLPTVRGLRPYFLYTNVRDPSSYFFVYQVAFSGAIYRIGLRYAAYREAIHRYALRLVLVALAAAAFLLLGFPLLLRSSVLQPLGALLEGVRQVEMGNYRLNLPVDSRDELGRLAGAYNRMVRALADAEGNFKSLAENANDGILILDEKGQVVFANARAAEISRYALSQLLGMSFHRLLLPAELAVVEEHFRTRLAGGQAPRCYETRVRCRDRAVVPVEITGARTLWHEAPADVVVIRDISERLAAAEALHLQQEQLLRADKLACLGTLVAGVAHEVNNPNQVIVADAHFLEQGLPALFRVAEAGELEERSVRLGGLPYPEFRVSATAAVEEIRQNAVRIGRIVGELKRFVRGGGEPRRELTSLNSVVGSVAELSRSFIARATEHFTLSLASDLPPVWADRTQLEQVVLNLVQNACQALPDRSAALRMATTFDAATRRVCVEVADEGIGIPPRELERIKEPFFTTRRESGGTGLGLSVSDRIVREHLGTLTFASQPGMGTTARVYLPAGGGPGP